MPRDTSQAKGESCIPNAQRGGRALVEGRSRPNIEFGHPYQLGNLQDLLPRDVLPRPAQKEEGHSGHMAKDCLKKKMTGV
ncbi:hypothetical protein SESBI_42563 [Sesbania bispinosa]|nr:hypothetical protein SESBI_42563 [Sesbania bispinosa]